MRWARQPVFSDNLTPVTVKLTPVMLNFGFRLNLIRCLTSAFDVTIRLGWSQNVSRFVEASAQPDSHAAQVASEGNVERQLGDRIPVTEF